MPKTTWGINLIMPYFLHPVLHDCADSRWLSLHYISLLVYLFVFTGAVFKQPLLFLIAKNFKTSLRKVMFHSGTTEMIKKTHSIPVISFTKSIHVISFTHSIIHSYNWYTPYTWCGFSLMRGLLSLGKITFRNRVLFFQGSNKSRGNG